MFILLIVSLLLFCLCFVSSEKTQWFINKLDNLLAFSGYLYVPFSCVLKNTVLQL